MLYPNVRCEHKTLSPQIIAKTLRNMSINKCGSIHDYDNTIIFFDNSHQSLPQKAHAFWDGGIDVLYYDIPDIENGYSSFPITYSLEWLNIQKILN